MEPFPDYAAHDAVGLAALVAAGQVHPLEVTEAAIAAIEAANPALNAVIRTTFDRARAQAAAPLPAGPFRGVPFLIKDLTVEAGEPVTFGSWFFRHYVADDTSELVERFRAAGLVSLGRTNTPELGLLPITEPALHGPTLNPWDRGRSPGGSSGGAAAAIAAGMVPMAHASDGGGSIRIPASACGLFGLKASRGRTPQRPHYSPDGLPVGLCLSRSVRDTASLLDAVHGAAPGDRWQAPPPAGSYAAAATTAPPRLRIAFTTRDFRRRPVHPDCAAAVDRAARLCEDLGHLVEEARPPVDGDAMAAAFLRLWAAIPGGVFQLVLDAVATRPGGRLLRRLGNLRAMRVIAAVDRTRSGRAAFEPFTWGLADLAAHTSAGELNHAYATLQRTTYQLAAFLESHDLLLTPVLGSPPVAVGAIDQHQPFPQLVAQLTDYVAFTPVANFTGFPAMSVPLHWNAAGLPIGVQFLAGYGREELLLALAGRLEEAAPWGDRRPGTIEPEA